MNIRKYDRRMLNCRNAECHIFLYQHTQHGQQSGQFSLFKLCQCGDAPVNRSRSLGKWFEFGVEELEGLSFQCSSHFLSRNMIVSNFVIHMVLIHYMMICIIYTYSGRRCRCNDHLQPSVAASCLRWLSGR